MILFIDEDAVVDDAGFSGALVRLSVDQNVSSGLITWDTEVYDTDAWHSTSSDTGRMTTPSGTSLLRLTGNAQHASTIQNFPIGLERQGADFYGMAQSFAGPYAIQAACNVVSALIEVSAGVWFNLDSLFNDDVDASENTWFAVERVPVATKRALVRKSSSQALSAGTTTPLTFDTEVYDIGGWFDSGVDNTIFTVPSGTSGYIRVCGHFDPGSFVGQRVISIRKAGDAATIGCLARDSEVVSTDTIGGATAVLAVSPGDTFDITAFTTLASTIAANEKTWFSIEEVLDFHGCLVYKDATQNISGGVEAVITFAAESYDTDGAHDNSTNPSRITVPVGSGFTRARPSFCINGPSAAGYFQGRVLKNGAAYHGSPKYNCDTAGGDFVSGLGAWVDVSEGDYFELAVLSLNNRTLAADNRTWLCVEFR